MRKKLPTEVFSVFGNLPLSRQASDIPKDAFGVFKPDTRLVGIAPDISKDMEWPTYWHEATHVACHDSGADNCLTEKQAELVCDAMGLYLTAMMRAGLLRVINNPTKGKK